MSIYLKKRSVLQHFICCVYTRFSSVSGLSDVKMKAFYFYLHL